MSEGDTNGRNPSVDATRDANQAANVDASSQSQPLSRDQLPASSSAEIPTPPNNINNGSDGSNPYGVLDKIRGWIEVSEQVARHYNERLRDSPEDVFRADLLDELVQQYDVSGVNLSKQFDRFRNRVRAAEVRDDPDSQPDDKQMITYEDFSDGLNSLLPAGADMLPSTAELVCKLIDRDGDLRITFEEFKEAIVKIKLSLLLNNSFQLLDMDQYEYDDKDGPMGKIPTKENERKHTPIGLVEFSWDVVQWAFPPTTGNEHKRLDWERSFYFEEYNSGYYGDLGYSKDMGTHDDTLHWVCLFRPWTLRTVLKLAVKYQLHPLAIEDMLNLSEERPKVDHYQGEFTFVVLPAVRLTLETTEELRHITSRKFPWLPEPNSRGTLRGAGKKYQARDMARDQLRSRASQRLFRGSESGMDLEGGFQSGTRRRAKGRSKTLNTKFSKTGKYAQQQQQQQHEQEELDEDEAEERAAKATRKHWENIKTVGRMKVHLETTNIGIFMQEPPRASVVITAHDKWKRLKRYFFETPKPGEPTPNARSEAEANDLQYGDDGGGAGSSSPYAFLHPERFTQGAVRGRGWDLREHGGSLPGLRQASSGGITAEGEAGVGNRRRTGSKIPRRSSYDDPTAFKSLEQAVAGSIFDGDIMRNILSRRSRMRQYANATWFVYEILDQVVDLLGPISEVYRFKLEALHFMLAKFGSQFNAEDREEIVRTKQQIERVLRVVRPLASVLKHIREKSAHAMQKAADEAREADIRAEAAAVAAAANNKSKHRHQKNDQEQQQEQVPGREPNEVPEQLPFYFDDVGEHLTVAISELELQVLKCTEMTAEYRDARDTRLNDVLYVLTFVSTVFFPAQFLTGLFGMNFASGAAADGLQDPMLGWQHGYLMFWILVVTLEVGAVAIFWKLGFVHLKTD